MKDVRFLRLAQILNMDAVPTVYHRPKARNSKDVPQLNALKVYSVVAPMELLKPKMKNRLDVRLLQQRQPQQQLLKLRQHQLNPTNLKLVLLTNSVKIHNMDVVKMVYRKQLVPDFMDAIVTRANLVVAPTKELQLKDQTKKVARRVFLNHLDVVVTASHQLMDRILRVAASNLDLAAVQTISMKLVDRISKIVDANIHPMDVVQIIKHRLEEATMTVAVANMLLTVAVRTS